MNNEHFFNEYGYEPQNGFDSRESQLNEQGMSTCTELSFGKGFTPCTTSGGGGASPIQIIEVPDNTYDISEYPVGSVLLFKKRTEPAPETSSNAVFLKISNDEAIMLPSHKFIQSDMIFGLIANPFFDYLPISSIPSMSNNTSFFMPGAIANNMTPLAFTYDTAQRVISSTPITNSTGVMGLYNFSRFYTSRYYNLLNLSGLVPDETNSYFYITVEREATTLDQGYRKRVKCWFDNYMFNIEELEMVDNVETRVNIWSIDAMYSSYTSHLISIPYKFAPSMPGMYAQTYFKIESPIFEQYIEDNPIPNLIIDNENNLDKDFLPFDLTASYIEASCSIISNGVGYNLGILNKITTPMNYKGSVATYADLNEKTRNVGDIYNVLDTGKNYAWDGTAWDDFSVPSNEP